MKKRWILLILPLMMMVMPVASANGWGLPEALVPLVSNTNDYDDYYHLADDYARKENSARIIMQSRYHNQLIAAERVLLSRRLPSISRRSRAHPGSRSSRASITALSWRIRR